MTSSMQELLRRKAAEIKVRVFLMDPDCNSRKEQYRIEPLEAALEDGARFRREILTPLLRLQGEIAHQGGVKGSLELYTYNFHVRLRLSSSTMPAESCSMATTSVGPTARSSYFVGVRPTSSTSHRRFCGWNRLRGRSLNLGKAAAYGSRERFSLASGRLSASVEEF